MSPRLFDPRNDSKEMSYIENKTRQRYSYRQFSAAELFADFQPRIHDALNVSLEPSAKVFEHGRSTRQDNVLVQRSPHVYRAVLNDRIHNLGDGSREIRIRKLRTTKLKS